MGRLAISPGDSLWIHHYYSGIWHDAVFDVQACVRIWEEFDRSQIQAAHKLQRIVAQVDRVVNTSGVPGCKTDAQLFCGYGGMGCRRPPPTPTHAQAIL